MVGQEMTLYRSLQACCENVTISGAGTERPEGRATFRFAMDFEGFQGHFPGKPVLPAVVQLAVVRCVTERLLKNDLQPAGYSRVKFRRMIGPEQEMIVKVLLAKRDDSWSAEFSITNSAGESIADGTCMFVLFINL